mmetsp:Transcript_7871/g.18412  ORF Transcript_7871/g.18412 Transcript_7871/m.18412 type:complete len:276 (+) Transcript_7871:1166-1993(+)
MREEGGAALLPASLDESRFAATDGLSCLRLAPREDLLVRLHRARRKLFCVCIRVGVGADIGVGVGVGVLSRLRLRLCLLLPRRSLRRSLHHLNCLRLCPYLYHYCRSLHRLRLRRHGRHRHRLTPDVGFRAAEHLALRMSACLAVKRTRRARRSGRVHKRLAALVLRRHRSNRVTNSGDRGRARASHREMRAQPRRRLRHRKGEVRLREVVLKPAAPRRREGERRRRRAERKQIRSVWGACETARCRSLVPRRVHAVQRVLLLLELLLLTLQSES